METFSALLAICAGNSPVPVNSRHKGQWRGALMFTLICPNKWLSKQSWGWWFETLSCSLWCHRNEYSSSPLNTSNVVPIILRLFSFIHFVMWNIYYWKINADNAVVTKEFIYKHSLWNKIVLHVCRPTLQHVSLNSSEPLIPFLCNILVPHTHKFQ